MSTTGADTRQRRRLLAAAARSPLFDPDSYIHLNADLADQEPFDHFARLGAWERRAYTSHERLTAGLARAAAIAPSPVWLDSADAERAWRAAEALRPVLILPRQADAGAIAAAEHCAELLADVGVTVTWSRTLGEAPPQAATELLFDAPTLFGTAPPSGAAADRLARAAIWVAACPDEPEFAAALPYALLAAGTVCRDADAYAALAGAGRRALWLGRPPVSPSAAVEPPDHPLVAGLSRAVRASPPGLPWGERPIEVVALEDATDARSQAWIRMADDLADFVLVLRRPANAGAHLKTEAAMRRWIYARSRTVLHLHRHEPRAVSTQAACEAADAGAALLCEPSPAHLLLRAGVHYAESSARRMGAQLGQILADTEGGARLATNLRAELHNAFDPERLGLQLVLALHRPGFGAP